MWAVYPPTPLDYLKKALDGACLHATLIGLCGTYSAYTIECPSGVEYMHAAITDLSERSSAYPKDSKQQYLMLLTYLFSAYPEESPDGA